MDNYKGYNITDWGTSTSIHSRAATASVQIRFGQSLIKRIPYKARDAEAKAAAIVKAKQWIDKRTGTPPAAEGVTK